MKYSLLYKPQEESAVAADFIPFFSETFHLYFLYDHRNIKDYVPGISWHQIETSDFVSYKDRGVAIKKGIPGSRDQFVFTGSAVKDHDGGYMIFYTAHSLDSENPNTYHECIARAVSTDLVKWEKDPSWSLTAPDNYESRDFRDPFVFYNSEDKKYWMLVCAKKKTGLKVRSGETLLFVSDNLSNWSLEGPLYAFNEYCANECPDLFKINNWWYLVFSEFSDKNIVHYRKSKSAKGPWIKPIDDAFDGRAFYASKTASDKEQNRFLFGWIPTRENNSDIGSWQWGGNLAVHELFQKKNGDLGVKLPETIRSSFSKTVFKQRNFALKASEGSKTVQVTQTMPNSFLMELDIKVKKASSFDIIINQNSEEKMTYSLSLDFDLNKLSFRRLPNFPQNQFDGQGLERPLNVKENIHIDLVRDNDIFICYINKTLALSVRFYNISPKGGLGLVTSFGSALVKSLSIKKICRKKMI